MPIYFLQKQQTCFYWQRLTPKPRRLRIDALHHAYKKLNVAAMQIHTTGRQDHPVCLCSAVPFLLLCKKLFAMLYLKKKKIHLPVKKPGLKQIITSTKRKAFS